MIEGGPVKAAKAKLTQSQDPSFQVEIDLNDEGMNGDRSAGDRIFSGTLPNPPKGEYRVMIEASDELGNTRLDTFEVEKNSFLPTNHTN